VRIGDALCVYLRNGIVPLGVVRNEHIYWHFRRNAVNPIAMRGMRGPNPAASFSLHGALQVKLLADSMLPVPL
jgi:hypothetical protein